MINKKLIHFNTFSNFNTKKLSANTGNTQYTIGTTGSVTNGSPDISYLSIVFIKDSKLIWTHGNLYSCPYTKEEIENLLPDITFDHGLVLSNDGRVVGIKIDPTSEPYIATSTDGLKVSGINNNINNSINTFATSSMLLLDDPDANPGFFSTNTEYLIVSYNLIQDVYNIKANSYFIIPIAIGFSSGNNCSVTFNVQLNNKYLIKNYQLNVRHGATYILSAECTSEIYDYIQNNKDNTLQLRLYLTASEAKYDVVCVGVMSGGLKELLLMQGLDLTSGRMALSNNAMIGNGIGYYSNFLLDESALKINPELISVTKDNVGLSNVDNTSDLDKPISTATQTALDGLVSHIKESYATIDDLTNHINDNAKHITAGTADKQILTWDATNNVAKWTDNTNVLSDMKLSYAYGVEWTMFQDDPKLTRIGNMSMHKTLPIQSKLKGCIAQGGKIMYYLDENDWRFRKEPKIINMEKSDTNPEQVTMYTDVLAVGQYIRAKGYKAKIISIDEHTSISNYVVTLKWENLDPTSVAGLEILQSMPFVDLGSRLDGYDGVVRVSCPEFYIKSEIIENICRVWISEIKIDDSWTYQPAVLVDAYGCTVLHSVPENMGYLSTLPVGSAVSIVNNSEYCRGGMNDFTFDSEPVYGNHLGKAYVPTSLAEMRTAASQTNSSLLSYDLYKNIFYWLYVIEYANFNSQDTFNSTLTSDGYHQGGLGLGLTYGSEHGLMFWTSAPIIPNGYGNTLGNNTGVIPFTLPAAEEEAQCVQLPDYGWTYHVNYKPEITSYLKGVTISSVVYIHEACSISNTKVFGNCRYIINGLTGGLTILFKEDNASNSGYENASLLYEATEADNGRPFEIPWSAYKEGGNRYIGFSITLDNCSITINHDSDPNIENIHYADATTSQIPRWRGFDDLNGDYGMCLDGILIDCSTKSVYTCLDSSKFADTLSSDYNKIGKIGYANDSIMNMIQEFDLGECAHIISDNISAGFGPNSGKCDVIFNNFQSGTKMLLVMSYIAASLSNMSNMNGLSMQMVVGSPENASICRTVSPTVK